MPVRSHLPEPVSTASISPAMSNARASALYTVAERRRRDASKWTFVQGVLAPLQFVVFIASVVLVFRYVSHGVGGDIASISVVLKTLVLYAIMITGSLWERDVYGCYLFAPAFYWEDVVSMGVIALHTLYLVMYLGGFGDTMLQLQVALLAYASYLVNAGQFLYKFRLARKSAGVAT